MTLERSQPELVTWSSSGQTTTNPHTDLSLTRSEVGRMGELHIVSKLRQKTKAPEETEEGSYPRRRHPLHRWYFSEVT